MSIIINSDEDLRKLSNSAIATHELYDFKQFYMLPAYRCTIHIGEYNNYLYVKFEGFVKRRKIPSFQIVWNNTVEKFIKIANEFGFTEESVTPSGMRYIIRPTDFTIEDENLLITKLINIGMGENYMKVKYGLK